MPIAHARIECDSLPPDFRPSSSFRARAGSRRTASMLRLKKKASKRVKSKRVKIALAVLVGIAVKKIAPEEEYRPM